MSREAVDVVAARAGGKAFGRQAVWEAVRALARFGREWTLAELRASCRGLQKYGTEEYVRALYRGGYLARREIGRRGRNALYAYQLVIDCGLEAPRLRSNGEELPAGKHQRLWQAMKVLKTFTSRDICAVANSVAPALSLETAASYARSLHQAGYLAVVSQGGPGKAAVYRLLRNSGGAAPQVQRTKAVFDPNTYEVHLPEWPVWSAE